MLRETYLSKKVLLEVVILNQPPPTELAHLIVQPILLPPDQKIGYSLKLTKPKYSTSE